MLRISLAVLHLIALAMGMSAIDVRARNLRRLRTEPGALRDVFAADTMWGISAVLWIATGLWRWLGSTEKAASYYMQNHFFLGKMGFLVLILLLEIWPMVTLIRWRIAAGKGTFAVSDDVAARARTLAGISRFQSLLLLLMLIFAVLMARGYGM